jgi:hypothetical protein
MSNFQTHSYAPFSGTIQIIVMGCNDHSHIHIGNVQEKKKAKIMDVYLFTIKDKLPLSLLQRRIEDLR